MGIENGAMIITGVILTISDSRSGGSSEDISGKRIHQFLDDAGVQIVGYEILPDEQDQIEATLIAYTDRKDVDIIFTTGGTGFGPRDVTPEAMQHICDKMVPGIPEAIRAVGYQKTPFALLSRGMAGIRNQTLIVNLPGSPKAVDESMDVLLPILSHTKTMLAGKRTLRICSFGMLICTKRNKHIKRLNFVYDCILIFNHA